MSSDLVSGVLGVDVVLPAQVHPQLYTGVDLLLSEVSGSKACEFNSHGLRVDIVTSPEGCTAVGRRARTIIRTSMPRDILKVNREADVTVSVDDDMAAGSGLGLPPVDGSFERSFEGMPHDGFDRSWPGNGPLLGGGKRSGDESDGIPGFRVSHWR
jgi:hypothetical protein